MQERERYYRVPVLLLVAVPDGHAANAHIADSVGEILRHHCRPLNDDDSALITWEFVDPARHVQVDARAPHYDTYIAGLMPMEPA